MKDQSAVEKVIGDALKDVASELRLIDATDFVAFLRTGQLANIGALVNSATELYFKPGVLRFGERGLADLTWREAPVVSLDMEFDHDGVAADFKLLLQALHAGVELRSLRVEPSASAPDEVIRRLDGALRDARRPPRKSGARSIAYN